MKKIKSILKDELLFLIILFVFSTVLSFYLGKMSVEYKKSNKKESIFFLEKKEREQKKLEVVASKNGKTFSYPWCSGAKRISEKNKIVFSSKKEAESKGYREAKNCSGF